MPAWQGNAVFAIYGGCSIFLQDHTEAEPCYQDKKIKPRVAEIHTRSGLLG